MLTEHRTDGTCHNVADVDETPVNIIIADTGDHGTTCNPTARDLAAQVPLTLTFTDSTRLSRLRHFAGELSGAYLSELMTMTGCLV